MYTWLKYGIWINASFWCHYLLLLCSNLKADFNVVYMFMCMLKNVGNSTYTFFAIELRYFVIMCFYIYVQIYNREFSIKGKFRREFRNALEKCRCGRARIEDRSLYHSTPGPRINNISPSSRSNYQLTSVRDITSLRERQVSSQVRFK